MAPSVHLAIILKGKLLLSWQIVMLCIVIVIMESRIVYFALAIQLTTPVVNTIVAVKQTMNQDAITFSGSIKDNVRHYLDVTYV